MYITNTHIKCILFCSVSNLGYSENCLGLKTTWYTGAGIVTPGGRVNVPLPMPYKNV